MGWGGARPGAGRKPKSDAEKAVTGSRRVKTAPESARVLSHPSVPSGPVAAPLPKVSEEDAPDDLTIEERHVWLKLAPHALAAGTLTPATDMAFSLFCRNIVLERTMSAAPLAVGTANHRGIIQRVQADAAAFCVRPNGKSMAGAAPAAEKPVSPLNRFLKKA